jgi:hypothetical protein
MRNNISSLDSILSHGSRGATAAPQAANEVQEYEAFAHGRVGNRPQLMVVFKKASGEVFAFSYISLTEIRSPNPNKGFVVDFSGVKVAVVGDHLETLFRYLVDHKAAEIIEVDRAKAFQTGADAAIVTSVSVAR